ncbi:hypothetical protein [Desulfovibrio inopinatus]|uniref:hypothetical protein n=1 Tax=Desulfovibrio inopinatus TaxID=102109 RepID=UPI0004209DBC|nr:hypothetical protein [Desulfovibrio inopinatus]
MKSVLSFLIGLCLLVTSATPALSVGKYSEGYRMGLLSKYSDKGYLIKTGEGEIMLGRDSSAATESFTDKEGKTIDATINPWRFSASRSKSDEIMKYVGEYVWVKYREEMINMSFKDTDYRLQEIDFVTRKDPNPLSYEIKKPSGFLAKSEGMRAGRIVKASRKGNLIKTWEVIVQLGNAGNQFVPMSISDESLFNYAIQCLKSGRLVKVFYVDKGVAAKIFVNMEDTPYRVYKLEVVRDL